jgi:hypothetical protein
MKPRAAYRAAVVLAGLGAVLTILAALDKLWLVTACGVLSMISGLLNVRNARRRGIGWDGPRTFRELGEMEDAGSNREPRRQAQR